MKEVFIKIESLSRAFDLSVNECEKAEDEARERLNSITQRIADEKAADGRRITQLKEKLKGSPRAELLEILAELEKDDKAAQLSPAAYWMAFYAGGVKRMHGNDRKRLEDRKAALEKELILTPVSPEEGELGALKVKTYAPTEAEREALAAALETVNNAYEKQHDAEEALREVVKQAKEAFEKISEPLGSREVALRADRWNKIQEAIGRMLKS